ncbi:glycoside hydrolase family 140 protein [soil metagenome]
MRQARILTAALLLACTADIAAQPGTARPPAGSAVQAGTQGTLPRLKVHPDRRYLVREDGTPFLYLSDTAWELFHRPTREQVRAYLELRARQNFTAIQAVALAEVDGISDPNAYGDLPLIDKDPARPAVTPGADPGNSQEYDYWDHVDYVVDEANRLGMYVAFLPTWARWLGVNPRDEKVITVENAQPYGEFLGRRYGKKGIIWVIGGDRRGDGFEDVWRAMAKGIAIGVTGREDYESVLMTYHPSGSQTSSTWFHNDPWLSFNMQQTGHGPAATSKPWEKIAADYERTPVKPVVEGEPLYEDHPIGFVRGVRENGFSSDNHVRQRAYWTLFAGAAGVAYGHHSVWQMYAPGRRPINGPLYFWEEAIHRPGAAQMQHVRTLMESRPMLSRVPDQSLVVDALDGPERIQAMRAPDHLFVYTGSGIAFTVNLGKISGSQLRGYWYNPRNGTSTEIGTLENSGTREFRPQYEGLGSDWVLVLEDAEKKYPAPGRLVPAPPPPPPAAP